MTREQLATIRARVEAATPGPWEAGTAFCCPDMGWIDGPNRMVCPVHETAKRTHTLDSNDAEFIAHAREDVPALLAEVERLTAERDHFKTQLRERSESLLEARETVERLTLERSAAFRRGVAAMREAAAQTVASYRIKVMDPLGNLATVTEDPMPIVVADIRALPGPEDTE